MFLSLHRVEAVRDMVGERPKAGRGRDQIWALREIDLQVRQGEILGIIGRNGAGKSTLLKILARIIRPTEGQAVLRGQVASLLEMGMGFERELTVRENVFMYGLMNNVPEREAMEQIERIAALAKLEEYLDTPLHHCPSGSYIRLAFSAVIHLSADVILADEVLAVGDAAFQVECLDQIRQGSEEGKAVLFVSHDMRAIRQICHRVIWLDKGRIVRDGDPDEVVSQYSEALLGRLAGKTNSRLPQDLSDSGIEHMHLVSESGAEIGALDIGNRGAVEFLVRIGAAVESFRVHAACFQDGRIALGLSQPVFQASSGSIWHRVRLQLPAHFFNELAYEVRAVLEVTEAGRSRFIEGERGLSFSVYNAGAMDSAWGDWPWGRPGYICPKLDWQVHKLATAAQQGMDA